MSSSGIIPPNNRFIITGGPGSGKTTLIEALQKLGYTGFPEIARDLIRSGMTAPIMAEKPGQGLFFNLILEERIKLHQEVQGAETGFYDRGIPDSLGYFNYMNIKVPGILSGAIGKYRYNPLVFVAPPWKEIFVSDGVRRETFEEAMKLFRLGTQGYRDSGYRVIELPESSVDERVAFILKQVTIAQQSDK